MSNKINRKSRTSRKLNHKICSFEDALQHASELKQEAEEAMNFEVAEQKVTVFKALADEIRLRILSILLIREMCVCEILIALELTQPTASHHLAILENAGLVKKRKEGKWVFYRVSSPELVARIRKLGLL